MKIIIQRVLSADVSVQNKILGSIGQGFCLFLGVEQKDTLKTVEKMLDKVVHLRIFEDSQHKMNLSLLDVNGALLIVSQFTLLADCNTGRRPSFTGAGDPDHARCLYEAFISLARQSDLIVQNGCFGADMLVRIQNDGPATFILESE